MAGEGGGAGGWLQSGLWWLSIDVGGGGRAGARGRLWLTSFVVVDSVVAAAVVAGVLLLLLWVAPLNYSFRARSRRETGMLKTLNASAFFTMRLVCQADVGTPSLFSRVARVRRFTKVIQSAPAVTSAD